MSKPKYEIPNDDDVSPEDIQPEAFLNAADLSEADLRDADLSGAILYDADLSGADVRGVDLSEADLGVVDLSRMNLIHTDLSGAYLAEADLSQADLRGADLSGADLGAADLSEADLRDADLSETYLGEVTLTGVTLSRGTELDPPRDAIEAHYEDEDTDISEERIEDEIARVNNQLKDEYSRNGLLSQGRNARARTRKARRKEIYAEEEWRSREWLLSRLASIFSGYGIKLRPVIGWMLVLYIMSAGVYWYAGGMDWDRSLYYSIVTFTTAPPETPPNYVTSIVAGIETFAGTAAIIFLGYVLSSRERI